MKRNEQDWKDDHEHRYARRYRKEEGLVERIKNDVKSWFDDDDRDDYVAGYGAPTSLGGDRYARRQAWNQSTDRFRNRGRRSRFGRRVDEYHDDDHWVTPGPHAGVGPKGYQRSPDSIKEQICERLEGNGELDASEIEVSADSDEVTLSGEVCSRYEKRLAEDCAESVYGVQDVHNRLTVKRRDD